MISRFIWNGKRPRIKYSTLQLGKEKGGMGLPKLNNYYRAAQLRPIIMWCDKDYNAKWKDIENCRYTNSGPDWQTKTNEVTTRMDGPNNSTHTEYLV